MSTTLRDSLAFSMPKAPRKAEFVNKREITIVPGPGYVYPKDDISSKRTRPMTRSLHKIDRYQRFKNNNWPGPQEYNLTISGTKPNEKKYSFGLRPHINPMKNRTMTGPGDYDPKLNHLRTSASITINAKPTYDKSKMSLSLSSIPGPGWYENAADNNHYNKLKGCRIGTTERKSNFLYAQ